MVASANPSMNRTALILPMLSFALSFMAWGLIGGLAPVFTEGVRSTPHHRPHYLLPFQSSGLLARLPMAC